MKQILIVEDDLDIADNLKHLLEIEGYQTHICRDGREALNRLKSDEPLPGLILLDLMMPVMDGFQFYEAQKKDSRFSKIPIVIMTAGGNAEAKIAKLGADAYFRKPLDLEKLFATIACLIG